MANTDVYIIAIPIEFDTADLQPGRRGRFIQHTYCYQQYKNSFYTRTISDWNQPTTTQAQRFSHLAQFQEQTTRLLLLSWYPHSLVLILSWVKRVFVRFRFGYNACWVASDNGGLCIEGLSPFIRCLFLGQRARRRAVDGCRQRQPVKTLLTEDNEARSVRSFVERWGS